MMSTCDTSLSARCWALRTAVQDPGRGNGQAHGPTRRGRRARPRRGHREATDLSAEDLTRIAEQTGIGAVKYADLATSRTKDYIFDVDRMVFFIGNTGVYLQYAHARISSILRKTPIETTEIDQTVPPHPAERELALALDAFPDALTEVGQSLEPHRLCGYLFTLAKAFTDFYEACPVLAANTAAVRGNRLALCQLTAHTLQRGLDLLGVAAPDQL